MGLENLELMPSNPGQGVGIRRGEVSDRVTRPLQGQGHCNDVIPAGEVIL